MDKYSGLVEINGIQHILPIVESPEDGDSLPLRDVYDEAYSIVRIMHMQLVQDHRDPVAITFVPSGAEVSRGICQCGYGHQSDRHIVVDGVECECEIVHRHVHCHNCGSITETSNGGTLYK